MNKYSLIIFDAASPNPACCWRLCKISRPTINQTLMVGDRPEDESAALAAGCAFMYADQFFSVEAV